MNLEINDPALERLFQQQLQSTGGDVEELLRQLLESRAEQELWLTQHREEINAKIRRGIEQLDRGEGIPEDKVDEYLAKLKSQLR